MDLEHDRVLNPSTSTSISPSSGRQSTRHEDSRIIKMEPVEDGRLQTRVDEAEEFGEESEGILADVEGVEYYCDAAFKIKQVSAPLIVQRTLGDLFNLSKTKYLKLDPEYQRDVVWDEARASALIASIIQGYFIPPIIFNVISQYEYFEDVNGVRSKRMRHYRICVDGKQRLTSVQKFMDGRIGVLDSATPPQKWFYRHPVIDGVEKISNRNILPETTKSFFRTRAFCCYEYSDLPESVEENMFQLVQRGMPLTPAERMRALSTEWAVFAKRYEEDYAMVVNLSKQTRASGFRSVLTIFSQILEVMHLSNNIKSNREVVGLNPTLQASPRILTRLLLDNKGPSEAVKAKFKEVFDRYQELVDLSSQNSPSSLNGYRIISNSAFDPEPDYLKDRGVGHVKTFSPLELVATAILLLVHGSSRPIGMLIEDVKRMRIYLRMAHKDLRLNSQCWASAWQFIETDLDLVSLHRDREAAPRNAVAATMTEVIGDDSARQELVTAAPTKIPPSMEVSPPRAPQVFIESKASSSKSFNSDIVQEVEQPPKSRAFRSSSLNDESGDDKTVLANKKQKHN